MVAPPVIISIAAHGLRLFPLSGLKVKRLQQAPIYVSLSTSVFTVLIFDILKAMEKSLPLRLENIEEDEWSEGLNFASLRPPETPIETMEFLARSWSLSATELSTALGNIFPPARGVQNHGSDAGEKDNKQAVESALESSPPFSSMENENLKVWLFEDFRCFIMKFAEVLAACSKLSVSPRTDVSSREGLNASKHARIYLARNHKEDCMSVCWFQA